MESPFYSRLSRTPLMAGAASSVFGFRLSESDIATRQQRYLPPGRPDGYLPAGFNRFRHEALARRQTISPLPRYFLRGRGVGGEGHSSGESGHPRILRRVHLLSGSRHMAEVSGAAGISRGHGFRPADFAGSRLAKRRYEGFRQVGGPWEAAGRLPSAPTSGFGYPPPQPVDFAPSRLLHA
jgi:hypothetical protein